MVTGGLCVTGHWLRSMFSILKSNLGLNPVKHVVSRGVLFRRLSEVSSGVRMKQKKETGQNEGSEGKRILIGKSCSEYALKVEFCEKISWMDFHPLFLFQLKNNIVCHV